MATDRPKIVIYSDAQTIERLDIIAKNNNRSRANMAQVIIEEYIVNNFNSNNKTVNIGRDNNGNINM